jgi:hypothetical protein
MPGAPAVLEVEAPRAMAVAEVEAPRVVAVTAVEAPRTVAAVEVPMDVAVVEEPRGCTTAIVARPSPIAPFVGLHPPTGLIVHFSLPLSMVHQCIKVKGAATFLSFLCVYSCGCEL